MAPEKAKPAGTSGGHREFSVAHWRGHEKNSLRGFLSLILPSGLVLNDCTYHQKDAARWIGLPARQYTAADGKLSWSPVVEFASKEERSVFQTAALEAVDRFMEAAR